MSAWSPAAAMLQAHTGLTAGEVAERLGISRERVSEQLRGASPLGPRLATEIINLAGPVKGAEIVAAARKLYETRRAAGRLKSKV